MQHKAPRDAEASIGGSFGAVDESADSVEFIRYLDAAQRLGDVQRYKQQVASRLRIRPGLRILDIGCGTGEDVFHLAREVGAYGRVVGIDSSAVMIAEARARAQERGAPVDFRVADAQDLGCFFTGQFDRVRVDRTLQHVDDPLGALREMARVTREGGTVVAAEPDWGAAIIDASDEKLTRRVLRLACARTRHGWIGRQLPRLFVAAGLRLETIEVISVLLDRLYLADHLLQIKTTLADAVAAGHVARPAAKSWLAELEERDRQGVFFAGITGFLAAGRA